MKEKSMVNYHSWFMLDVRPFLAADMLPLCQILYLLSESDFCFYDYGCQILQSNSILDFMYAQSID